MEKEIYRCYGRSKFDKSKFVNIVNRYASNKPYGGLWASPTKDKDIDWYEWCTSEHFNTHKLKEYFDFTLKDNANILIVKDLKDVDKLPRKIVTDIDEIITFDTMNTNIDFEKLTEEYDGIMVYMYRSRDIDIERMMYDGMYYRLYGWDVDTLLVFNPDVVEEV
jgi:hypothetical protein